MSLSLALFPTTHKVLITIFGSALGPRLSHLPEIFFRLELLGVVFVLLVVAARSRRWVLRQQPILPNTVQLA